MEMLLCGRVRNGREGMGETLKDTVGVHTPGLSQAEKLQVMVAELRLPCWSIGTYHPPILLWPVTDLRIQWLSTQ